MHNNNSALLISLSFNGHGKHSTCYLMTWSTGRDTVFLSVLYVDMCVHILHSCACIRHTLKHAHTQVWCWSGGELRQTVQSILFGYWIRSWRERDSRNNRERLTLLHSCSLFLLPTHKHTCSETVPLHTHTHTTHTHTHTHTYAHTHTRTHLHPVHRYI